MDKIPDIQGDRWIEYQIYREDKWIDIPDIQGDRCIEYQIYRGIDG